MYLIAARYLAGGFQIAFPFQLVDVFAGDKLNFAIGIARERNANTRQENILINGKRVSLSIGSSTTTGLPCALAIVSAPVRVPFYRKWSPDPGFNAEPGHKTAFAGRSSGLRAVGQLTLVQAAAPTRQR